MRALVLAGLVPALALQAQPRLQPFTLPNGLRVLHLEDHEHPLVRARLLLKIAPSDTPQGRQGLSRLMLRMLGHTETADLKAEDLDRILEESGIQLAPSLDPEGLCWRMVARSRDQDRALGLLADRVLRTVFNPTVLEVQRLALARRVEGQEDPPLDQLQLALLRDPATAPTLQGLGAITLEDLLAFHARVFRPERAVLVLHGDLGLEQAKRLVLLSLGSWSPQEPPKTAGRGPEAGLALPAPPLESRTRISVAGRGLRIQAVASEPGDLSHEAACLLGLLIPGDTNLLPVQVSLRDGHLLATLDSEPTSGPGTWSVFHGRLEAFRQRGFTQVDLDHARRAWLARRSLESLHPEAQMDSALTDALGRGVSEARLNALTLEQLNAGLRTWLDPARFRIGAVGDPDDLKLLPKP